MFHLYSSSLSRISVHIDCNTSLAFSPAPKREIRQRKDQNNKMTNSHKIYSKYLIEGLRLPFKFAEMCSYVTKYLASFKTFSDFQTWLQETVFSWDSTPPPPPPSNTWGGRMRIPIFSGKEVSFGRSLWIFPEKAWKRGCFLLLLMVTNTWDRGYIHFPR